MLGLCTILFIRKGTCAEIYSQNIMISQQILSSKHLLSSLALLVFSAGAFANGDPTSFLKFSTDFDAKCVVRGGVMIYISNTHSTGKIKVLKHLRNFYQHFLPEKENKLRKKDNV